MSALMTKAERTELAVLVRGRAKNARGDVDRRVAEQKADVERRLAARASAEAPAFADLLKVAKAGIAKLDAEIAERCQMLGIPAAFRPSLECSFYGRGENASASRRGEIRRTAFAAIEAGAIGAKHRIDRIELEQRERLAAGVLTSDDAKAFLEMMPSVDELIPAQSLPQLSDALASLEIGGHMDTNTLLALGVERMPALLGEVSK